MDYLPCSVSIKFLKLMICRSCPVCSLAGRLGRKAMTAFASAGGDESFVVNLSGFCAAHKANLE